MENCDEFSAAISEQYETLSYCYVVSVCFSLIKVSLFKGKIHPEQLNLLIFIINMQSSEFNFFSLKFLPRKVSLFSPCSTASCTYHNAV